MRAAILEQDFIEKLRFMLQILSFVDWTSTESVMQWKWGGNCPSVCNTGFRVTCTTESCFGSWMRKNKEESAFGSKINVKLLSFFLTKEFSFGSANAIQNWIDVVLATHQWRGKPGCNSLCCSKGENPHLRVPVAGVCCSQPLQVSCLRTVLSEVHVCLCKRLRGVRMVGCDAEAEWGQEVLVPEEVHGLKGWAHARAGEIFSNGRELNSKGF